MTAATTTHVIVRDARPADARQIADIWAAAIPFLARSAARAAADLERDGPAGRRRWVAELDGAVVGTASARPSAEGATIAVEVDPRCRGHGVGGALLDAAVTAFPDARTLTGVCGHDPSAIAFSAKRGFVADGVHWLWSVDPRSVAPAGPVPAGLVAVPLDALADLQMLLDAHNASVQDDPSGLSPTYTLAELRAGWWSSPDHAPELSWGLVDETATPPVIAAFTRAQVDRGRGRAWSSMTATRAEYRGRGLALWVKRRTLAALAGAGVTEAWTANDASNAAMVAINQSLGYRPMARSLRLRCKR
jgi:GNAT superfamily N-acetyltransferase